MSGMTAHVLDTSVGKPAVDLEISLERATAGAGFSAVAAERTNQDGRVTLLGGPRVLAATYRITFQTGAYFTRESQPVFYPRVEVIVQILDAQTNEHFHIPLLISPFGYSTYRGS